MSFSPVTLAAPAKLNLYLHVTGRRADGYHLLDSLVAFTDIYDTLTLSPACRRRITETQSRSRASRSGLDGHGSPVTCSFRASPLPSAAQNRPGNISSSVAIAWAVITGWYRCPGAVTRPMGKSVRASAAPIQLQA